MKNIKVTVIDSKTLELLEPGDKGDRIDLNTIHDIDIDSSEIAELITNVKDKEFNKKIDIEKELLKQQKDSEYKEILRNSKDELNQKIRELELDKVKLEENIKNNDTKVSLTIEKKLADKEKELTEKNIENILNLNKQISTLKNELATSNDEKNKLVELEKLKDKNLLRDSIADKEKEINKLVIDKNNIINDYEKKLQNLENQLSTEKKQKEMVVDNEKQKVIIEYTKKLEEKESDIKSKEKEIALLNDFKFKQSTKMIGETLEQHFLNVWEQTGKFMFPKATFKKDNQLSEDMTKGDFIYREFDDNGVEILSIMFEMKNENETTNSKHKNSDFYFKLDKDRKMKSCEYAVLASLLEKDVEYFNDIYTVDPNEYDKMYVIRPQHFITLINFLRQGNLKAQQYKLELNNIMKREIDVTNFEENLKSFQESFNKNYLSASKNFTTAIEEIDKSITHLQKIRDALTTSDNQLRLANKKSEELSIKKLTEDAPSIREMFENKKEKQ